MPYEVGVVLGLAAGTAAAVLIVALASRRRVEAQTILLVATASAALLPYVLPKMHDRFFFPADLLTVAFAFARPRKWPIAALCQLGSILAYMTFLGVSVRGSLFAILPMSIAVGLLALCLIEADDPEQEAGAADAGMASGRATGAA